MVLLWIVGEILVGVLLAGLVAGLVVPVTMRAGLDAGPWLLGAIAIVCIIVCVFAGEQLRGRNRTRRVP